MQNLADAVLDYLCFLNFCEEEECDPDSTLKLLEDLVYQIENKFTEEEKQSLKDAAQRRLAHWLREPDEHGYTPRKLLTPEQKSFLEDVTAGRFSGPDFDDED